MLKLQYVCWRWPSWMEVRVTGHNFENWPLKDHPCHVCFKLAYWFQRRRFLNIFPIGSYVKTMFADGCHLGWRLGSPYLHQHQKHKSGRGPSSEHFWQVWLISVQRFQRRRFKCEKLTDGRTTTHDKSSHGLWPGELKSNRENSTYSWQTLILN